MEALQIKRVELSVPIHTHKNLSFTETNLHSYVYNICSSVSIAHHKTGVYMIILIHLVMLIVSFTQIPLFQGVSMCAALRSSVVKRQKLAPLYVFI